MINNIYINGYPLAKEGVSYIKEVQGVTAPTIDLQTFNRGGRDGIVLGNPYYRQRVFTITLAVIGNTPTQLLTNKDQLMTSLRLQQYEDIPYKQVEFVTTDGQKRSCQAIVQQISGELKPETSYAYTPLVFQMIANRWYLEGEEHTQRINTPNYGGMAVPMDVPMSMANNPDSTTSQIVNLGNTESLPTFHISGPLESFDIYSATTGQRLSVNYQLNTNEYIELDTYSHAAVANSVTNIRGSVNGDWLVLPPGPNEISFIANQTEAQAVITYKDAYLGI